MKPGIFNKPILFCLLIFFLVFFIYLLSNYRLKDHYKHQTYLAYSLLKGHFDLIDYPADFYHDVFYYQEKAYTAFSPFPILFLTPLVFFFGKNIPQILISILVGALNSVVLYLILKKNNLKQQTIVLTILAFSLGTLNWYSAVIGTSWFFSHTLALFFLLLSILCLFNKKYFWCGLFFGLAFSSRYPILMSLPVIFWLALLNKGTRVKELFLLFGGIVPGVLIILAYNYFRFDNVLETGYQYANTVYLGGKNMPEFSPQYIPRNINIFLFKKFDFINRFPFLKPDPQGLSIFLTSPFLIYALVARKNKFTLALWLAVFLISLVTFTYFLTGWYQFGYRFMLDFLPFLIILAALGIERSRLLSLKIFLISSSIIFNLLGVYWGLKLGW